MLRLPRFQYHAPESVAEAADLLARSPGAMLVAGGTDVVPAMKRRQFTPPVLIGLRRVSELHAVERRENGLTIGAGVSLAQILELPDTHGAYPGLWQAVAQIATPQLRNMGTIGGNLCLDTRCNYYDQSYEWRKAIGFCMKKDGDTCWVATSSPKCVAVSSTDTAPILSALGATVTLTSASGTRSLPVASLHHNDGIHYLARRADEVLTAVHLPPANGWQSVYWKLRRRGAFDFPVLSVAAAVQKGPDGTVQDARIVLGAVASAPLAVESAAAALVGNALDDRHIEAAAELASRPAKPLDNTDFSLVWRKRLTRNFVTYALRELRGDDVRALRWKVMRSSHRS